MDGRIINDPHDLNHESDDTTDTIKKAKQAAIMGIDFIVEKLMNIDQETTPADSVILWTEKLGKMIDSLQSISNAISGGGFKKAKVKGGVVPSRYETPTVNFR